MLIVAVWWVIGQELKLEASIILTADSSDLYKQGHERTWVATAFSL